MSDEVKVKILDKDTWKNTMDALILAVAGVSANSGSQSIYSSYGQLQALIRNGLGAKILPVETQLTVQRETGITISIGDSTGITAATINEDTFLAAVGEVTNGIYEAHYDGAVWHKEDESNIDLAAYGIQVTGTPVQGDHIVIKETASSLVFDVLDHDKHTFQNTHLSKGVVIGMHNLFNYGVLPFCPSQLHHYAASGLAVGKYKFTLVNATYGNGNQYDGTYVFEITTAIPAGGGWRHNKVGTWQSTYQASDVTTGTITTYGAYNSANTTRPVVQSGIAVRAYDAETDSDAVDLGTFSAENKAYLTESNNLTRRAGHGNNRWRDSLERQWLNSTARAWKSGDTKLSQWYSPQSNFDIPPSESVLKMAGFLHGIDAGLLELIQPVAVVTALTDADKVNSGDYDITYDRIWLQSMTEMGLGNNNGVAEGSVFAYWQAKSTKADRIKYEGTTARYWWLRSPYPSYAGSVRNIYPSGDLSDYGAGTSYGVVPACVLG